MSRIVLCCAALGTLGIPCRADEPTPATETVIRMTLSPAPAAKPALRYVLLPHLGEMNPGNPIQDYLKCFMEQQKFFFDKEESLRREKLLTMPIGDLPAQELLGYGGIALTQADWAARLDKPDWQILMRLKADGINVLIPDVQQMRTLASALKVRFRAEVARDRFDDAIRTAKTLFAMSRHLSEHPTFVGELVGISVAFVAIGPLEEMMERPACPNLYWALTSLPSPMIPLDRGREGERVWIQSEFRDLDESYPMSADRLKGFFSRIDRFMAEDNSLKDKESLRAWVAARVRDEGKVDAARRRLVEAGHAKEKIQRFPAEQVILLDDKREYGERCDDVLKLLRLPIWQLDAMGDGAGPAREQSIFADLFIPAAHKVHLAQARLDQRLAMMRDVEAIRMYAAGHGGAPPKTLSDISVPLADDPFTGKPFRYEVRGDTIHLRGTPPRGMESNPTFNVRYELTFRR